MNISMSPLRIASAIFLCVACGVARAETYYSDPVGGKAEADGSAKTPWPALSEIVKDGKLAKLQGGDTLLLGTGNHGDVTISGTNSATVTIAAAPGHTPQLSRFELTEGSKWLVKGLTISPSFASTPYKGNMVTLVEQGSGSDVVFEDCFVYTALDSSKWTKEQWMEANNGVLIGRAGTDITVRNTYILNTRFGLTVASPDSLVEGNIVTNFSGDGLRLTRDNITAQYNVIKNAFVSDADGDKNHDDLIQCFLHAKGTGQVNRLKIVGNILLGMEGSKRAFSTFPQGIGFFDGPLVEFTIEKNIIESNTYHGISLYDAVDCKILDNVVKAASTQKVMPWISLNTKNKGGSRGNVVKNNKARAFVLKADPSVDASNNTPISDGVFNQRLKEQEKVINGKFGEFHPVAKLSRLGDRKGEYKAPVALD